MDPNRKSVIWETLVKAWKDNPVAVVAAGGLAITSVAKLIDAVSSARGRRAYAKQVNYRIRHRK
jgi:hypothetical protein